MTPQANAFSENITNYKGNKILTSKFHQDLWQIYESEKEILIVNMTL